MLPSETMIWQPEFTDKTLSRKPGAVQTSRNREPVASGFGGEIHVHLHNVVTQNPRELAKLVGEMVRAEMERRARAGRGSFYDKD
ncbi:hypothetical protein, partial [Escherichia coli]|uniref:hypothetical protein n=2 Tax=Escherichia coli TaxID=562 RepID=UPI001C60475A